MGGEEGLIAGALGGFENMDGVFVVVAGNACDGLVDEDEFPGHGRPP